MRSIYIFYGLGNDGLADDSGFPKYDEFVSAGTDGGYALAGAYRSGGEFVHDWALDLLKRYWYS